MKHVRWYDKNPNLKDIFEYMEGLDEAVQGKIGQDILQILMNDFNLNLDEKINSITKNYNYECNRWYDNNIDLFVSFAIIKDLPEGFQEEVVKKIVESILFIYTEGAIND